MRLLVPAWVVNATPLPISAIVLPKVRPPPKPAQQQDSTAPGRSLQNADALMSAANAMADMRVLESGYEIKCVLV